MTTVERVLEQALALAPEDRAMVADRLEQSLEQGGFASPEIGSAWTKEIERRVAALGRGELQAEDADVALARMRRFLAERQAVAKS